VEVAPVADTGEEFIRVIPSALWVLVALIALILFREPIRALVGRLQSARLPGNVELRFGPALEGAVEKRSEQLPGLELELSPGWKERLLNRARRSADAVVGARVLWVDDEPEGNAEERQAMDALGIEVITARSTGEAEPFLEWGEVDLVISNQVRGDDREAGYTLREAMYRHGLTAPLILYIAAFNLGQPASQRIFAVTNRPDELLDYVLDALIVHRRGDRRRQ
jgi:hypothetical protein